MRLLIVDDDLINRKLLSAMLRGYGESDIAVNGREAIECFKLGLDNNELYDIVFLDIMMPEMDGHETLQAIRSTEEERGIDMGNGVKVVMVTALGDKQNVLSAFSEGCEYYLVKPIRQNKLFELMEEMGYSKKE